MPHTYYIPVERKALPASDPKRWFLVMVEAAGPVEAIMQGTHIVRDTMRLKGATIWAAVRDVPSFDYMQELRDSFGQAALRRAHPTQRKVPGYV